MNLIWKILTLPKRSINFLHIDIGISFDPYNLINFVSVLFVNFVVHPMKNITNDENYIEHSKAYQFPALFLAPPTLVFPAPPDVKHLWSIRDLDFRYPSPTGIMVFHSENCQSFLRICIDFWKNKKGRSQVPRCHKVGYRRATRGHEMPTVHWYLAVSLRILSH